ncbi:MAG: hypothetical protein ACYSX1_05505 [Planctomycetota bacterium]
MLEWQALHLSDSKPITPKFGFNCLETLEIWDEFKKIQYPLHDIKLGVVFKNMLDQIENNDDLIKKFISASLNNVHVLASGSRFCFLLADLK